MQQNKKKVLVTGANGFIGRHVVTTLAIQGWMVFKGVRVVDSTDVYENVYLDLSKLESILSLENKFRFDAIVHIGSSIGFYGQAESELFVENVLSTGCLSYLVKQWNAQLIFTSAAIIHGARASKIEGSSPIDTDTAYAKSKWLAEELIKSSGIEYCILRISGVFGVNGPTHLGLNRAIDSAINGEELIQIGTGRAIRNYIYVQDVADLIFYILQQNLTGIHLVSGHEDMTITNMLEIICEIFLPTQSIVVKRGREAEHQRVIASPSLPKSRGFRDAILDIQKRLNS